MNYAQRRILIFSSNTRNRVEILFKKQAHICTIYNRLSIFAVCTPKLRNSSKVAPIKTGFFDTVYGKIESCYVSNADTLEKHPHHVRFNVGLVLRNSIVSIISFHAVDKRHLDSVATLNYRHYLFLDFHSFFCLD